jgi:hypothetical protein
MPTGEKVGAFAIDHPRLIASVIIGFTVVLSILAVLPSLWPYKFKPLHSLKIDTDPENMLPDNEPVRLFHDQMKTIMSLNDMIVVGIINEADEAGVFNPESLKKIYALTQFAQGLRWRNPDDPTRYEGVIQEDMIAPSLVDNVESGGAGVVRFEWLMSRPPETREGALAVKRKAMNIPFLKGTLVSEDGKAIAIYLPITSKDLSHRIYRALKKKIDNPSRLFRSEIGNVNAILHRLAAASKDEGDLLVRQVWQVLSPETRQQLLKAERQIETWQKALSRNNKGSTLTNHKDGIRRLLRQRQDALEGFTEDLNAWMEERASDTWLNPEAAMLKRLSAEGQGLLNKAAGKELHALRTHRLKRLWIEAAFSDHIIESPVPELKGDEEYHITGLPVAEDTFGVEMFKQIAVSAPLAMLIIFLLMWFFFKSAIVILPAIYDAIIATVATMALLVVTGNTVHIMSSMIPIFIVPIAVLDDVHVISEFFDSYQQNKDKKKTLVKLMGSLFTPMLYTTLTTAVGFASLALAPIPPVQVFGLFVAFGVVIAWLCSILLVPAFISVLPGKTLEAFGAKHFPAQGSREEGSLLGRILRRTGKGTYRYAKPILIVSIATVMASAYGIGEIRVNDNPTKWFEEGHPIRVADRVLNDHFGGTYMAYLSLRPKDAPALPHALQPRERKTDAAGMAEKGTQKTSESGGTQDEKKSNPGGPDLPMGLEGKTKEKMGKGPALPAGLGGMPEEQKKPAEEAPVTEEMGKPPIFKDPTSLRWIGALERYMKDVLGDSVGKSNSVTTIVETVHRELMVGVERNGHVITEEEAMRIPDTRGAVAQSLLQFQNSHRPQDLWHFVTPDYRTAVVWLQLTSGDNRDMGSVARGVNDWIGFWAAGIKEAEDKVRKDPERFRPILESLAEFVTEEGEQQRNLQEAIVDSPLDAVGRLKQLMGDLSPAEKLRHDWFGLTYINVVWQEKMVVGMLYAFLGSFLAVFLMMTMLYRSALWGTLCMAPLTVTIAMIYGLIGLVGKDYDMPVAVLSALSLGLAVDYAIHFLTRSRMMYLTYGSWEKTAGPIFGEPARAISRNAIVVGIGFLPLLLAPLVPYKTVGLFIAAILLLAGISTMLLLPSAVTLLEGQLFPRTRKACVTCNRVTCFAVIVAAVALVMVNIHTFVDVRWTALTWISVASVLLLMGLCLWSSKGEKAKTETFARENG